MMDRKMWKGNEALAEAALRGGCEFYAGYPITPQTEVMEYLSAHMEAPRKFIQASNEMSAVYMVLGAAAGGMRAMTSSSGPGISLKQEGISFLYRLSCPAVLVNVQRWGFGLGNLDSAQTDYLRDTRGGGNGDYRVIVQYPASVQELIDMMYGSFELAEKYRMPVEILTEASLGQMMEPAVMPPYKEKPPKAAWIYDGRKKDHRKLSYQQNEQTVANRLDQELVKANEQKWEAYYTDDAEFIFVSIGLPSRSAKKAVDCLRKENHRVGLIRPINVWPFPFDGFAGLQGKVKGFLSVESTDAGQLVEDVALAVKKAGYEVPIYGMFTGGKIAKTKEIVGYYQDILAGCHKEVF